MCHVVYPSDVVIPEGFGYLIPRGEKEEVLGVVFDSNIFPHENKENERRLSVMLRSDRDPIKVARDALRRHLGILSDPIFSAITEYKDILPQYELGHVQKIAPLLADQKIIWVGNYLTGASVNACFKRSKQAIETLQEPCTPHQLHAQCDSH